MPPPNVLTYSQVLHECDGNRHLLLGNGFSIACFPDIFKYDALFNRADFSKLERAKKAFEVLGTTNFEAVIRALRGFSLLAKLYAPGDAKSSERAKEDADGLREVLVTAVAGVHPNRPHNVPNDRYLKCREFLRGYKSINTLNYDLLLYWTLMQTDLKDPHIECDDGFRKPAEDPGADYVSWDPDNSKSQTVRYLHGALHLYDTGSEMKKYTWIDSKIALIDQIRSALKNEFYPVFVSEGTNQEKLTRIRHNDYLCKMFRSFTEIRGDLVVFGHSLDESDDHIFRDRIGRHGKTKRLYVSLLGAADSQSNKLKIERSLQLVTLRKPKWPLEVKFFDADSASVWK